MSGNDIPFPNEDGSDDDLAMADLCQRANPPSHDNTEDTMSGSEPSSKVSQEPFEDSESSGGPRCARRPVKGRTIGSGGAGRHGRGGRRGPCRGRGRGRAGRATDKIVEVVLSDSKLESESQDNEEPPAEESSDGDTIVCGGGLWKLNVGRTVDPWERNGYRQSAIFKLFNFTEKNELDYFSA